MYRELGRLAHGYDNTKGTNTILFILRSKVPSGRTVTYMTIVCTHQPSKSYPEGVRLCVGSNRLEFDRNIRTPTADLTTVKILIKSTIPRRELNSRRWISRISTLARQWMYMNTVDFTGKTSHNSL